MQVLRAFVRFVFATRQWKSYIIVLFQIMFADVTIRFIESGLDTGRIHKVQNVLLVYQLAVLRMVSQAGQFVILHFQHQFPAGLV